MGKRAVPSASVLFCIQRCHIRRATKILVFAPEKSGSFLLPQISRSLDLLMDFFCLCGLIKLQAISANALDFESRG